MKTKDERDEHFAYSIIKSGFRILGCCVAFTNLEAVWAWQIFIGCFFVAEILGIVEEL
tara:strand:+ start:764 stop:937 length:174 start_codon:yes stop_codon:yes gene_type:complete